MTKYNPYGTGSVKRLKPKLRPYGGYDPQSAQSAHRKLRLPIKAGELIYSGMIISAVFNATTEETEWVAGLPDDSTQISSLAFADGDSLDEDIAAAGVLPGLLCSGTFDLHTGYFATETDADGAQTYNGGVYLTPCTDADLLTGTYAAGELRGYLKTTEDVAEAIIVGSCHVEMRGPINLGPVFTAGENPPVHIQYGQDSTAIDLNVVRLNTMLKQNPASA